MSRTHFSADHHFCHSGILRASSRPWADVNAMEADLIALWNAVVAPRDVVWYLGDFAHKAHAKTTRGIFDRLHGQKQLVVGNHDGVDTKALPWASVADYAETVVDGHRIVMSHYAMRTWNGQHRGALMLFGHSHARLPDTSGSCDVGVDAWNFAPCTLQMIQERLVGKPEPEAQGDSEAHCTTGGLTL